MATIIITELQQTLTTIRSGDGTWRHEAGENNHWETELFMASGGVLNNEIKAVFDTQTGEFLEATIIERQRTLDRGGLINKFVSREDTIDFNEFRSWLTERAW